MLTGRHLCKNKRGETPENFQVQVFCDQVQAGKGTESFRKAATKPGSNLVCFGPGLFRLFTEGFFVVGLNRGLRGLYSDLVFFLSAATFTESLLGA